MKYERPIVDEFIEFSSMEDSSAWTKFQEMLQRKQRARISIQVTIRCHGQKVGERKLELP